MTEIPSAARGAVADRIPVLDMGPYLAGEPGALPALAAELREACERVGFFFLRNHGVPWDLVDATFEQARRFHDLPLERKLALKANEHNVGYMGMRASLTRTSPVARDLKPNVNEAFFVKRDRAPDDPKVLANKLFCGLNQWPDGLPGFRQTLVAYSAAAERLAKRLARVYAVALDLPEHWFDQAFDDPQFALRLSHYPPVSAYGEGEYGTAPHTDSSFMTLLPQSAEPGLSIMTRDGGWIDAPIMPEHYLVNTGDQCRRWTNHRFLSTPHRVRLVNPNHRYAIPFFFDANVDYVMECLPTCQGPDNPPLYPPTTYTEYMTWFMRKNYDHARDRGDPGAAPGTSSQTSPVLGQSMPPAAE